MADPSTEAGAAATPPSRDQAWKIGDSACLAGMPRYLKTADPMPMLRPPDLVDNGEVGVVVAERALGQLAVRFRRGTFLLGPEQLVRADAPSQSGS